MAVKDFFKKLGSDTKKAFSKGGAIDVGFRKAGNTLSKIGQVGEKLLPLAAVAAPELAPALMTGSVLSQLGGRSIKDVRKGVKQGSGLVNKVQNAVSAAVPGIQAAKDIVDQSPDLNFA
jgi:hypothetical protein